MHPAAQDMVLTVWVPPVFDPSSGTPAGNLLKERLQAFELENPGLQVSVRIKAVDGPASLLDTLTAASAAAPAALPDLVALSQADLENAALKGLLVPLDGLAKTPHEPDWFAFTRQLAILQGSTFGLPFAADSLVLVYRPARVKGPFPDWDSLLTQASPLAFPVSDPEALLTLSLYQSLDGPLQDGQGRPVISADPLSQVLQDFERGVDRGVFPSWLTPYETGAQTWQAFDEQRSDLLITWVSAYLAERPPDGAVQPLPGLGEASPNLATGWVWALSSPQPDRQQAAAQLAEFLVDPVFLAAWTEAAGFLPTRPTALAAWQSQELQTLLSPILLSARTLPSTDLLSTLGPVLREATLQVVKDGVDPVQAAEKASERLVGSIQP
jgi:ABC-type glycerol-3-phosphate transport system substrate-binding protein